MNYRSMIEQARAKGVTSEKAMLAGIESVNELLEEVKHAHPSKYWAFLRKTHEHLYGCHYDEEFARYDISQMHSTDSNGRPLNGEYWSKDEVLKVTQGKVFPTGTTDCDKWVAYNAAKHDFGKRFSDAEVLDAAYMFYFADEDAKPGKVWRYMLAMSED